MIPHREWINSMENFIRDPSFENMLMVRKIRDDYGCSSYSRDGQQGRGPLWPRDGRSISSLCKECPFQTHVGAVGGWCLLQELRDKKHFITYSGLLIERSKKAVNDLRGMWSDSRGNQF